MFLTIKKYAFLWLFFFSLNPNTEIKNHICSDQRAINPNEHVQLLIKMPTRSRPEKFFAALDTYYKFLSHKVSYLFLISCDEDDASMNNEEVRNKLARYPNLVVYFGNAKTKIEAYNLDIDKHPNFDIIMAASDDMIPEVQNYDEIIVNALYEKFPDLDGAVHFNDGADNNLVCTLSIMGKKLYKRFGYIYNPIYKSWFCDDEFTEICKRFKKIVYFDKVLIRHINPLVLQDPVLKKSLVDSLYLKNAPPIKEDRLTRKKAFENNFYVTDNWLTETDPDKPANTSSLKKNINKHVQLLIKMPTRSRPEKFFTALDAYYKFLSHKVSYLFLISCDEDDASMNNEEVRNKLARYPNLVVYFGNAKTKIEAYNLDIDKHPNFDIIMAASDDMIPEVQNYDEIIVNALYEKFPDLDGAVHFNDGYWRDVMCTLSIMGNKLYRRFGYIYYPEYKSICCDYEFTTICSNFKKLAYFDTVLIRHAHPLLNKNVEQDTLFIKNTKYDHEDVALFEARKKINLGCRKTWLADTDPDKKS